MQKDDSFRKSVLQSFVFRVFFKVVFRVQSVVCILCYRVVLKSAASVCRVRVLVPSFGFEFNSSLGCEVLGSSSICETFGSFVVC